MRVVWFAFLWNYPGGNLRLIILNEPSFSKTETIGVPIKGICGIGHKVNFVGHKMKSIGHNYAAALVIK